MIGSFYIIKSEAASEKYGYDLYFCRMRHKVGIHKTNDFCARS